VRNASRQKPGTVQQLLTRTCAFNYGWAALLRQCNKVTVDEQIEQKVDHLLFIVVDVFVQL
jgi:hypothetical protein